jgi:hypothetical protein
MCSHRTIFFLLSQHVPIDLNYKITSGKWGPLGQAIFKVESIRHRPTKHIVADVVGPLSAVPKINCQPDSFSRMARKAYILAQLRIRKLLWVELSTEVIFIFLGSLAQGPCRLTLLCDLLSLIIFRDVETLRARFEPRLWNLRINFISIWQIDILIEMDSFRLNLFTYRWLTQVGQFMRSLLN